MDRRPPLFSGLLLLTTCVSLSDTSPLQPPPPPPGPFADFRAPDSALTAVAAIEAAFADPAYRSFVAFAPSLSITGGHAPYPAAPGAASRCASGAGTAALSPAPGAALTTIPDSLRVHVFAFDSASQSFRTTTDTGAPANGVRFLLAAVDTGGRPVFPLTTVGWLDVTDQSAGGGSDSIGAVLANPTGPLLTYVMTPQGTVSAYSERVVGDVGGGGTRLQFTDSTSRVGTQVAVTMRLDDAAHGLHATLAAARTNADRYDWFYSLDFRLRFGNDSVRLKGANDVYCLLPSIGVTVFVHDSTFATLTNGATPATPTITRGDSLPLTPTQAAAVLDLLRLQGELFSWMETFALPGSLLLGS